MSGAWNDMQLPRYCIIYNKAVKMVRTPDGGISVLAYVPEEDRFERALGLLHRIVFAGSETDFVSEQEFEAYMAQQRAEAQAKRQDDQGKGDPDI